MSSMSEISIANYDANHPVLYIKSDRESLTLRIRRNEGDALWVDYNQALTTKTKFDAFVVAPNQKGIIEFKAQPLVEGVETNNKFDVIKILTDPKSVQITNRRQFFRLNLTPLLTATLTNTFGEQKEIQIESLSGGGISLVSQSAIEEDEIYLLSVNSNFDIDLNFALQILKPRSLGTQITNEQSMVSKIKIPAYFITSKKQTHFKVISDKQQSAILQYINKKLRQEQTIKK